MKITDVEIGGRYIAKVSGQMTTVRVLAIRAALPSWHDPDGSRREKCIDVVNVATDRLYTFRSAKRLLARAPEHTAPQPEGGA